MQSGIVWFNFSGMKYKCYFHNIANVEVEKNVAYTFDTLKWVIKTINANFGFRPGRCYSIFIYICAT